MSDNSTIFNGTSRYSSDLQQVLARAVAIASLPLNQLNNQLNTQQAKSAALDSVDSKFAALQTAIQNLGSATVGTSADVSDSEVLQAHSDSTARPGSYAIHVIDPGSHSTTISNSSLPVVSDPSSTSLTTSAHLTLTVAGNTFAVDPAANNLLSLVDAINASGANVSATLVNVGPPSAPNYRLSIQSTALGNVAIQLNDGSQDLLGTLATGALAQYQVNGLPATPISSDSSTVTISPGVTVDLLQAGDSTIDVSQTQSAVSDSLTSLVAAYNAAVDELAQNRGLAGGALTGDVLISSLSQQLRNLAGFTGGSGSVQNITDLGLTFDSNGHLQFNQDTFDAVANAHPADLTAFLGSATTGGFLKSATDILKGLEDPTDGTIETARTSAQALIAAQNQRISDEQDRIDQIQANLTAQISAADALIASLEQKVSYFTSLFDAFSGKQNG